MFLVLLLPVPLLPVAIDTLEGDTGVLKEERKGVVVVGGELSTSEMYG